MSNINAAIGLIQLKKIDAFIERRRNIVGRYNERIENLKWMKLLEWNLAETAPFSYIVRILDGRRNEAMDFLEKRGVGTGVHYIANHTQPFFSAYYEPLPTTEQICGEIMTIPLFFDMSDDDVSRVIEAIVDFSNT